MNLINVDPALLLKEVSPIPLASLSSSFVSGRKNFKRIFIILAENKPLFTVALNKFKRKKSYQGSVNGHEGVWVY